MMTIESTVGNKLLANFLGYKYVPFSKSNTHPSGWWETNKKGEINPLKKGAYICRSHKELMFDKSWDNLMRVVIKIEGLRIKIPGTIALEWFEINRYGKTCLIQSGLKPVEDLTGSPYYYSVSTNGKSEILAVWESCIKFVIWYNEKINTNE